MKAYLDCNQRDWGLFAGGVGAGVASIRLGVYTSPDGDIHRFLFCFINLVYFLDGDNPVY